MSICLKKHLLPWLFATVCHQICDHIPQKSVPNHGWHGWRIFMSNVYIIVYLHSIKKKRVCKYVNISYAIKQRSQAISKGHQAYITWWTPKCCQLVSSKNTIKSREKNTQSNTTITCCSQIHCFTNSDAWRHGCEQVIRCHSEFSNTSQSKTDWPL